ncbi:MAG: imidazole glycerol phosphate synthase subunit HisH [Desulfosudaceae bacterium]
MIAIVDYEAGNLTSVARALTKIGYPSVITGRPEEIAAAGRVIFPGVGAAGSAMKGLTRSGLDAAVRAVVTSGRPLLGICLGTQVIMEASRENETTCLGIVAGTVKPFPADIRDSDGNRLKIPHMGWNHIRPRRDHPVLAGIAADDQFYFVHSYFPEPADESDVAAATDYGLSFASVLARDNLVATQFHPEKSGAAGLRLLDNFCRWQP